jgi:threonine dehydrogenase-like Zn-dependent dehydrogenase
VHAAALRGLGSQAEILVLARHAFQADGAKAGRLRVISSRDPGGIMAGIAELTGASVKRPLIGKPVLLGGAEIIFECVGSDASLDDSLRLARNGGRVVVVGMPGIAKGVDWTAIFSGNGGQGGHITTTPSSSAAGGGRRSTWRST